jgi:hypothetical protein
MFAPIPGGEHRTISNDHCSLNFAWIVTNLGVGGKFARQLSFALLFVSVSAKRTISKFRSNSRRGTCNNLHCTTAPSILLGFGSTIQGAVSLLFSFLLHYFSAPFEHFLRKELSQIFALIPGGPHATPRAELFMLVPVAIWRFTLALSRATSLVM